MAGLIVGPVVMTINIATVVKTFVAMVVTSAGLREPDA